MTPPTVQSPSAWLPPEQTTFVGRAAELERLGALLATARLVTVTGTGGVGKTRLALRAAAALPGGASAGGAFPDGVRLVELSALRDPELLANTIAAVLELPEQDPRPRTEQVLDHLDGRRALLILDTCEHLIEACALFAEAILTRTSDITILATSREPLLTPGEHEYPLAPLAVPDPRPGPGGIRALPAAGEGSADDAVELFARRAAAVVPGFSADDAGRADIARICRLLDGIPLAIELAAAQLRTMSLSELAERMGRRFLGLAARQDSTTDRHRTLRDAIGWSYELCTPAERALWERMAVFAGPVDADAARQVCGGPGPGSGMVMNSLIGLVDKSVLTRGGGHVSRYGMLDTIREYGAERLAASGAETQVRARHLRRYLGLAAELAASPLDRQMPKYQALSAEHADIRAALEHAASLPGGTGGTGERSGTGGTGARHPALQLAVDLEWYWVISARMDEGRHWLTKGIERAPEPGPDRAAALAARGYLAFYQGDVASALADTAEAITVADEIGDRLLRARGLVYRSFALIADGSSGDAGRALEEARALLSGEDSPADAALAAVLAIIDSFRVLFAGDIEGAVRLCERQLRMIPADSGERWASAYLLGIAGLALTLLGRPAEGSVPVRRGIAMKYELGDTNGLTQGLGVAALVAAAQRRHERAAWLIGAATPLWKQIGAVFAGMDLLQALIGQAADEASAVLGVHRFESVVRDAAAFQVGQIVDLAVRDADRLPALPSGTR